MASPLPMGSVVRRGAPLALEALAAAAASVRRLGYVHLPGVVPRDEIDDLRMRVDRIFEQHAGGDHIHDGWAAVRLFELDQRFRDLTVCEPILSLARAVCGQTCRLLADTLLRNPPGIAVSNWHVDDTVYFPLPDGFESHAPGAPPPVIQLNIAIPLTDIPTVAHGPTQLVPESHLSGREPNDATVPTFAGREPISMLSQRGDIYAHNNQVWHRGAPNTSTVVRYFYQLIYGPAWAAQRFYTGINYAVPAEVLAGADDELLHVLGKPIPGIGS